MTDGTWHLCPSRLAAMLMTEKVVFYAYGRKWLAAIPYLFQVAQRTWKLELQTVQEGTAVNHSLHHRAGEPNLSMSFLLIYLFHLEKCTCRPPSGEMGSWNQVVVFL